MMKKNKKNYNQVSITNNIRWLKTKMAVHKIWRRLWWRWWGIRSNNDDNVDYDDDDNAGEDGEDEDEDEDEQLIFFPFWKLKIPKA